MVNVMFVLLVDFIVSIIVCSVECSRVKEPRICDSVKQYSGYIDLPQDKLFFFWFFESRSSPSTDPLILWLNGGPGASSLIGLFAGHGPCRLNFWGNSTTLHPYSWNTNANIIFLDQPLNTGFSYGSPYVNNSDAAAMDSHEFLVSFFIKFPQYKRLDFHIFGSSYAGQYIPRLSKRILMMSQQTEETQRINLKSVGIGNGLTDPLNQYEHFYEMACNNSYNVSIPETDCEALKEGTSDCLSAIQTYYNNISSCKAAGEICYNTLIVPYFDSNKSLYDLRKSGGLEIESSLMSMEMFLSKSFVTEEIGAKKRFEIRSSSVQERFLDYGDASTSAAADVAYLLDQGIRVLIYAGDADFLCNWLGNKAWLMKLNWSGNSEFIRANDTTWNSASGKHVGDVRQTKTLTFLRVFDAGHTVTYDQPAVALEMLNLWMTATPF